MTETRQELRLLEKEAERLVDEAGISSHVEALLTKMHRRGGRPRELPVKALFVALQLMAFSGRYYLNDVAKVLNGLSRPTRERLGLIRASGHPITNRQVQYLTDRIDGALRRDFTTTPMRDESRYVDFDAIFSAIAKAGAHPDATKSSSVAVDASDIPSWGTSRNVFCPVVNTTTGEESYAKALRVTDPDAAWRGAKDHEYKKPVFGYEVTVAVSVRDEPGDEVPRAALAARFRPINVNGREAALACIEEVAKKRGRLGDVLVDREYTQSKHGEDFLNPVRILGGEPVFALKQNQVGPSGVVHGAIIIDGQPFSPSMPTALKKLVPPSGKGTDVYKPSPEALAEYQAKVKARSMYALVLNEARRPNGTLVFQCPSAAGKLGCPLQAPARPVRLGLLPAASPPKRAVADTVCAKRFRSFEMTDLPLYQRHLYGSKEWFHSYARRGSSIEPHFGALKDESAEGLRRGKFRVRGIVKTGLMVAFALASTNRRLALAWDRRPPVVAKTKKPKGRPRRQAWTSLELLTTTDSANLVMRT